MIGREFDAPTLAAVLKQDVAQLMRVKAALEKRIKGLLAEKQDTEKVRTAACRLPVCFRLLRETETVCSV